MKNKEYNGWLLSNNILKRSFAILGHLALAQGIVVAIGFFLIMVFG